MDLYTHFLASSTLVREGFQSYALVIFKYNYFIHITLNN
jgi:hypothetical protein